MKKLEKLLKDTDTVERCGLILKDGTIIEVDNIAEVPEQSFEIPAEKLVEYEDQLAATWHTHPFQSSIFSEKDYFGFLMWPSVMHYIIGTDGVSAYKVEDGVVLNAD